MPLMPWYALLRKILGWQGRNKLEALRNTEVFWAFQNRGQDTIPRVCYYSASEDRGVCEYVSAGRPREWWAEKDHQQWIKDMMGDLPYRGVMDEQSRFISDDTFGVPDPRIPNIIEVQTNCTNVLKSDSVLDLGSIENSSLLPDWPDLCSVAWRGYTQLYNTLRDEYREGYRDRFTPTSTTRCDGGSLMRPVSGVVWECPVSTSTEEQHQWKPLDVLNATRKLRVVWDEMLDVENFVTDGMFTRARGHQKEL